MHYRKPLYRWIYLAGLLSALHYASTIYINSSFLAEYFSQSVINLLYTAGALVSLVILIASSRLIRKIGIYRFALTALVYEIVSLIFLTFTNVPEYVAALFIIHASMPLIISFSLDIFLEGSIRNEHTTGTVRSNYLTIINTAFVISPLLVGFIVDRTSYHVIYGISAFISLILFLVIADNYAIVRPTGYREINFVDSIRKFVARRNLVTIFFSNFFLQSFYALMVIFTPLYLHEYIKMPWTDIGIVFTIMLLPFVIFQAPLGRIFDAYRDEKDVAFAGFLIMSATTISIFFINSASILVWAAVLFTSRIGASFVEVASESAFFRHVNEQDAGFISIFRMSPPISYTLAPLTASIVAQFLPLVWMFPIVGALMLVGAGVAHSIKK